MQLLLALGLSQCGCLVVAADDLDGDGASGGVLDFDAFNIDDVGRPVLGIEYSGGLRWDTHDVVSNWLGVNGQPAAGRQIEVEEVELGQQALSLGLLVGRLAQPPTNRQQSSNEFLLGSKTRSSTGT